MFEPVSVGVLLLELATFPGWDTAEHAEPTPLDALVVHGIGEALGSDLADVAVLESLGVLPVGGNTYLFGEEDRERRAEARGAVLPRDRGKLGVLRR